MNTLIELCLHLSDSMNGCKVRWWMVFLLCMYAADSVGIHALFYGSKYSYSYDVVFVNSSLYVIWKLCLCVEQKYHLLYNSNVDELKRMERNLCISLRALWRLWRCYRCIVHTFAHRSLHLYAYRRLIECYAFDWPRICMSMSVGM